MCPLRASFPTFVALLMLACGSTTTPSAATDERADASTSEPVVAEPSSDTPDASTACEPAITTVHVDEALLATQPGTDHRVWIIRSRNEATFMTLTVRESAGAAHGSSSGTFGDEQRTPAKAPVGLLVQTDCHAHGDHYHCGPSFIPLSGSWSFTELDPNVGGPVVARISAELVQAKVTGSAATPIANGKKLCLRELSLEGTLAAP